MKYVDDVNIVMQKLEMGTRWVCGKLETRDSWAQEDREAGKSQESVTMDVVRGIAESVIPWLEFTSDLPEDHKSKMVPMLDLEVWVVPANGKEECDKLGWRFFEKKVNTQRVLRESSALTWRCKLVSLSQECFRRLRNTARQVPSSVRTQILCKFVNKLRSSGYTQKTVNGLMESGTRCYYRKLSIELQGGPRVNNRDDSQDLPRRRRKMGEATNWFRRRRGGPTETARKDNGWRSCSGTGSLTGGAPGGQSRRRTNVECQESSSPITTHGTQEQERAKPDARQIESTLLIPYTKGAVLQKMMQRRDDQLTEMTGSRRVRVVESGGDKLVHLLRRNDPGSTKRFCKDKACTPCGTRAWLVEKKKDTREMKEKLPKILISKTSRQCRREGVNYTLQCLLCLPLGKQSLYRGESSHSARGRQGQHARDISNGVVTNPLVIHSIKEHGGVRPVMAATIDQVEARPLYRAVREAVRISQLPDDSRNLNRCQEWGQPRVPVLSVTGGDVAKGQDPDCREGVHNPRKTWSENTLAEIERGGKKRVRYWDENKEEDESRTVPDPEIDLQPASGPKPLEQASVSNIGPDEPHSMSQGTEVPQQPLVQGPSKGPSRKRRRKDPGVP